jgi:hypothetical protein
VGRKTATYDAKASLFKCAGDAKKDFEMVSDEIQVFPLVTGVASTGHLTVP